MKKWGKKLWIRKERNQNMGKSFESKSYLFGVSFEKEWSFHKPILIKQDLVKSLLNNKRWNK